jgi:hypothetical protein
MNFISTEDQTRHFASLQDERRLLSGDARDSVYAAQSALSCYPRLVDSGDGWSRSVANRV